MSRLSKAIVFLDLLAPYSPITDDEAGCCVFCMGHGNGSVWARSERFIEDHNEDCPWVEARKFLGDRIPSRYGNGK